MLRIRIRKTIKAINYSRISRPIQSAQLSGILKKCAENAVRAEEGSSCKEECKMAKNKMKSHRGACKRMKLTGSGKIRRHKAYKSHILTKKTPKRKRGLRKSTILTGADHKRILRAMAK